MRVFADEAAIVGDALFFRESKEPTTALALGGGVDYVRNLERCGAGTLGVTEDVQLGDGNEAMKL